MPEARFFATPRDWRAWLEAHHETESELWLGFFKVGSGRPSISWSQSVEEALCFGWIDGVRRSVDAEAYMIRFTPRRPSSAWSEVNLRSFAALEQRGLVTPAGRAAHARRRDDRTGIYSFENRKQAVLSPTQEARFRADQAAWDYFTSRPQSYRTAAIWWVISAKREATRERRLAQLIADSKDGRTIGPLTRP